MKMKGINYVIEITYEDEGNEAIEINEGNEVIEITYEDEGNEDSCSIK
jgi:hypothetical protein